MPPLFELAHYLVPHHISPLPRATDYFIDPLPGATYYLPRYRVPLLISPLLGAIYHLACYQVPRTIISARYRLPPIT